MHGPAAGARDECRHGKRERQTKTKTNTLPDTESAGETWGP